MNILATEQRQFIISLYSDGEHSQAAIAELAGTTQSNVSKILAAARKRGAPLPIRMANPRRIPREQLTLVASQLGSAAVPLDLDFL